MKKLHDSKHVPDGLLCKWENWIFFNKSIILHEDFIEFCVTLIMQLLFLINRLVVKMNVNRTVNDIRNYICTARPSYNGTPFILMTTFPNKELSDENVTIQDAKLLNACIVQRLK